MIRTLRNLVDVIKDRRRTARKETDETRRTIAQIGLHDASMDLAEALLRHLAVVALAMSRHSIQGRDVTVSSASPADRIIADQLPWPTMGSWKNFLDALANSDPERLPEGFHAGFLKPLRKKTRNEDVRTAFAAGQEAMRYAVSPDEGLVTGASQQVCTPLEFLTLLVRYRNEYEGHATRSMTHVQQRFTPHLERGVTALCHELSHLWLAYPIYLARQRERTGATYIELEPLVVSPGIGPIEVQSPDLVNGRLYIRVDEGGRRFASLYPIALWREEDILFLNGAKDYREIRYLGYVSHHKEMTDKHDTAFCDFILPFMGGISLENTDLEDARVLAQASNLVSAGWRFPKLARGDEFPRSRPRYRLIDELNTGGMAVVWKAERIEDRQEVAIKFLRDPDLAPRLRREARAQERLSRRSDRIVEYIDAAYEPHPAYQVFYLVMELLPAGTLLDQADREEPPGAEEVLGWLGDSLKALRVIHEDGAVHRDVTPTNLMFDASGRIKLGDLGLVGQRVDVQNDWLRTVFATQTGDAVGTYAFCSIEQLEAGSEGRSIGPAADVFSLGATFYYLLTRTHPYGRENLLTIVGRQRGVLSGVMDAPAPVHEVSKHVPEVVSLIIMEMIQVDPDRRPAVKDILIKVAQARKVLQGEKVNIHFNLAGHLRGEAVEFRDLMPRWCRLVLFTVWPAVMFLQWVLVIPLAILSGSVWAIPYDRIPFEAWGVQSTLYDKPHPFIEDYFFITWNLLPFALVGLLLRARNKVQGLIQRIHELDANRGGGHWNEVAKLNNQWAWFFSKWWFHVALAGAAAWGLYMQWGKLADFQEDGDLYWWDPKVSWLSYIVRDIALAVDVYAIILAGFVLLSMVHIFAFILRGSNLRVDLLSSDRAGGLADVGRLLLLFQPFVAALAAVVIVATVDHRGQFSEQIMTDWGILAVLMVLHFSLPILSAWPVHRQIRDTRTAFVHKIEDKRYELQRRMQFLLDGPMESNRERVEEFKALRQLADELTEVERAALRSSAWPIRRRTAWTLLLAGIAPIVTAVLLFVLTA